MTMLDGKPISPEELIRLWEEKLDKQRISLKNKA